MSDIISLLNAPVVQGTANALQIFTSFRSNTAASYSQLIYELQKQTKELEDKTDSQTNELLEKLILQIEETKKQNIEIISLLKELTK